MSRNSFFSSSKCYIFLKINFEFYIYRKITKVEQMAPKYPVSLIPSISVVHLSQLVILYQQLKSILFQMSLDFPYLLCFASPQLEFFQLTFHSRCVQMLTVIITIYCVCTTCPGQALFVHYLI